MAHNLWRLSQWKLLNCTIQWYSCKITRYTMHLKTTCSFLFLVKTKIRHQLLLARSSLSNHNHFFRTYIKKNTYSWYISPTFARGHVISSVADSWPPTGIRGAVSLLASSLRRASSTSADLKACWDRAFSWAHFSRSAFSTDSTCSFVWREFWNNKYWCYQFFEFLFKQTNRKINEVLLPVRLLFLEAYIVRFVPPD